MTSITVYDRAGAWVDTVGLSYLENLSVTTAWPGGLMTLSGLLKRQIAQAWFVKGAHRLVMRDGLRALFDGEIVDLAATLNEGGGAVTLGAQGAMIQLRRALLRRFYLDNRLTIWEDLTQTNATRKFQIERNDRLFIGAKKDAVMTGADYGALRYTCPEADTVKRLAGTVNFAPLGMALRFGFYDVGGATWITGANWTTSQVNTAYNVTYAGAGTVELRLASEGTFTVSPRIARVFTTPDGSTYYDWAAPEAARDAASDIAGGAYVGGLPGTAEGTAFLYVGSDVPFSRILIPLGRHRNERTSTLTAAYYNEGLADWATLTIDDGTNSGGTTLYQGGAVTFTNPGTAWGRTAVNGSTAYWVRLRWSARLMAGTAFPRRSEWWNQSEVGLGAINDLSNTLDGDETTTNTITGGSDGLPFETAEDYIQLGYTDRFSGFYINMGTPVNAATATISAIYNSREGDYGGTQFAARMGTAILLQDSTQTGGASMAQDGTITMVAGPDWRPARVDNYGEIFYMQLRWGGASSWTNSIKISDVHAIPDIGLGLVTLDASPDTPAYGEIVNPFMSYFTAGTVYASDILADAIGTVTGLSASTAWIQNPGTVIAAFVVDPYETVDNIGNRLAATSDSAARQWGVSVWAGYGVTEDNAPYVEFKPRDTTTADLLVHPDECIAYAEDDIMDALFNFLVIEYRSPNGRTVFLSGNSYSQLRDDASITKWGRRQRAIRLGDVSQTLALQVGAAYLARWSTPPKRIQASQRALVRRAGGGFAPAAWVRSGMVAKVVHTASATANYMIVSSTYNYELDEINFSTGAPPDDLSLLLASVQEIQSIDGHGGG